MKVRMLIEMLRSMPADAVVILQKDAEGNGYSPCSEVEEGLYVAETTWSGEVVSHRPARSDGVLCVVLVPVN